MYGHKPKKAAERAPLASTYAQYREWKRAIRTDAAVRIQCLFRGARLRKEQNGGWERARLGEDERVDSQPPPRTLFPPAALDIPVMEDMMARENGTDDPSLKISTISPPNGSNTPRSLGEWSTDRRVESPHSLSRSLATHSERSTPSPSHGSASVDSTGADFGRSNGGRGGTRRPSTDFSEPLPPDASLPELMARKRDLKTQLKAYDMNFMRNQGRMPYKAEKEPIRHLYMAYNSLKSDITAAERASSGNGGRSTGGASRGSTGNSLTGPGRSSPVSPFRAEDAGPDGGHVSDGSSTSSRQPEGDLASLNTDLASLKTEKAELHQMLRSYEREFSREHGRQVSSFNDIRPVHAQYRRYKDVKRAIAQLQRTIGQLQRRT